MYSSDSPLKSQKQLCFKHMKLLICGFKDHVANLVSVWHDQKCKLLVRDAVLSNPISPTKFERSLRKIDVFKIAFWAHAVCLSFTNGNNPKNVNPRTMDHLMLMHSFECFFPSFSFFLWALPEVKCWDHHQEHYKLAEAWIHASRHMWPLVSQQPPKA